LTEMTVSLLHYVSSI